MSIELHVPLKGVGVSPGSAVDVGGIGDDVDVGDTGEGEVTGCSSFVGKATTPVAVMTRTSILGSLLFFCIISMDVTHPDKEANNTPIQASL